MKLYFDLLSQPSRALYIFLKLNKIPFEPMVTKLGRLEHLSESFKKVNRFQRVPCIVEDNGFKLAETVAIFNYIVAKNPTLVADHWYPKDIEERAKVDEYLNWQHLGTRLACAGYVKAVLMIPLTKWNYKLNPKKVEAAKGIVVKNLDILENVWLKDSSKPFLATKELSFADVLASCEIDMLPVVNFDAFEGRPKLEKWHQLVKEQTNPVYDEAHAAVYPLFGTYDRSKLWKLWKIFFSYNY